MTSTLRYPMRLWARAMSNVSSDVYLYWFNYYPPVLDRQYKAFHGGDLPYVFGQLDMFGGNPVGADFVDADTVMSLWTRFAVQLAIPMVKILMDWEAFTPSNERYYILGPENAPAAPASGRENGFNREGMGHSSSSGNRVFADGYADWRKRPNAQMHGS